MTDSPELHLFLGRLEGKVDTLVNLHTTQAARIDAVEARMNAAEQRIVALESSSGTGRVWLTNILSGLAFLVSLGTLVKEIFIK